MYVVANRYFAFRYPEGWRRETFQYNYCEKFQGIALPIKVCLQMGGKSKLNPAQAEAKKRREREKKKNAADRAAQVRVNRIVIGN